MPELGPGQSLEGIILSKIDREKNRIIKEKKAMSYAGMIGSVAAILYLGATLGSELLRSEFWSVVSLAGSDLNVILGNWTDYAFSLLETVPAMHIAAVLLPVFTLLLSLNLYSNLNNSPRLNTR